MAKQIAIVVAMDKKGVIGNNGTLPWKIPGDLKRFRELTEGNVVIMGRHTYDSIGKPLPNRLNVILTRDTSFLAEGCLVTHTLEEAVAVVSAHEKIFIIGGAEVYRSALPIVDRLYISVIDAEVPGTVRFPLYDTSQWKITSCRGPFKGLNDEYPWYQHEYQRIT
jgi:dihydrofolate reductase